MRSFNYCNPLDTVTIYLLSIWSTLYASSVQCVPINPSHRIKANLLQSSGFRIHARIDVWQADRAGLAGQVELTETYSVANERSMVELRILDDEGPTMRRYHVNGSDNRVTLVESEGQNCKVVDRNSLLIDMLSYMAVEQRQSFIDKWIKLIEGVPDYVLGVGRILQYVDENRDQMNMTVKQSVRERGANRYAMNSPFGSDVNMSASLAQSAFINWNGAELPVRVWLKSDTFGLVMIDFFLVEPLTSYKPLEDTEYYLDPTTVELGLRCLAPVKQDDWVNKFQIMREVYSMTTEVIDVLDDSVPMRRFFLAFDGKQMAFRRDVLNLDGSLSTSTIYDFKRQLKFNLKHPRQESSNSDLGNKPPIELGKAIEAKVTEAKCIAAVSSGEQPTLFSIPYSELVHMGSGIVRGIEVDIYENYNFQQPHLFFPPASFTNRTNEWQIQSGTPNGLIKQYGKQFSAIYYFARSLSESIENKSSSTPTDQYGPSAPTKYSSNVLYSSFSQLVRVDLMLGGRLLKKVNVHEFVWQLSDGPNADRQEKLFSVPNVCFRDEASSRSNVFKMTKQQVTMKAQLDFVGGSHLAMNEEHAMIMLGSPVVRHKAIVRALVGNEDMPEFSSSRILEISSSLTKSGRDFFKLHTSLKLSLAEGNAWQPNWQGTYVHLWNGRVPVESATNFDECFYEAVRRRRQGELLFAFIHNACYIDLAPIYEVRINEQGVKEIEFTYSSVFRITRMIASPHLGMRIELVPGKGRTVASKFGKIVYDELMDKFVSLPIVDTRYSRWVGETIITKVSRLDFVSRQGDDGALEEDLANNSSANSIDLNGLVLMTGLEVEKSSMGEDMSYEVCRASCHMDIACRSYSVCTRGLVVSCRTSELDLADPNLIGHLGRKLKEARAAKSHGVTQVSFEYQPSCSIEVELENHEEKELAPPVRQQVILGLDKRCRVYKKRALDMFLEMPRSVAMLNGKVIMEADNEEECAKYCLDNNVQFFSQAPNVSTHTATNDQELSQELLSENKKRMSKWCSMFKYLNMETSSNGKKLIAQLPKHKKAGICILSKARGGLIKVNSGSDTNDVRAMVEMDTFEFEYVNLYEPIHEIQMSFESEFILQDSPVAGPSLPRRKLAEMSSPEECARACFTQAIGLEPQCKSFEFVKLTTDAGKTSEQMGEGRARVTTLCAFNSISLHDATEAHIYDQVVSLSNNPQAVVTFYEPRRSYMMSDSVLRRLISTGSNQPLSGRYQSSGHLSLLLLLIVALASGIGLGVTTKEPLVEYLSHSRNRGPTIQPRRFSNSTPQDVGENL